MRPDDRRATPSEVHNDGKEFDPTNRVVLFGHHFASIAGAGSLVGPVLAAQMDYLPSTIWIIYCGFHIDAMLNPSVLWQKMKSDVFLVG